MISRPVTNLPLTDPSLPAVEPLNCTSLRSIVQGYYEEISVHILVTMALAFCLQKSQYFLDPPRTAYQDFIREKNEVLSYAEAPFRSILFCDPDINFIARSIRPSDRL